MAPRLTFGSLFLGVALFVAPSAFAAAPGSGATFDESNVNYDPGPPLRRGGFAMGLSQGLGYGTYTGYPLEVAALNDPDAKQSTGPALASQFNLWMGAALRDFLTFGLGVSLMSTQGKQVGGDFAFLIHLEAYPFFYKGGFFRDFGISIDGGLGVGVILERDDDGKPGDPVAEGGAMSNLGVGAFWEPLRFWHFSAGPLVNYVYGFSQTMQAHQGVVGFRFVFYGNQPKKQSKTAEAIAPVLRF
jgi:hypothetical protein